MTAFCIPCQWSPPRHCGRCPCCRDSEALTKRYRFYRLIHGQKIYLFCRNADTPNRSNAALYTEADWQEWAEREGLQREGVSERTLSPSSGEATARRLDKLWRALARELDEPGRERK